ncbi:unnamed protein product [Oncorhynchus mykiss]|uniref:Uncharacterized protein n=1 Tax=Oncorhynchus mykiss TaxID=8022 RepID=A0A060XG35_ONCMY|nr:unnamed protein product [Oncorhynchus mykiss]
MWHLADRVVNNAGHFTPVEQPEAEDGDQFLSFAKRSKVVQRQCSEMETEPSPPPQSSSLSQSRDNFWHRILCQPSEVSPEPTPSYGPVQMQMFSNKPEGLVGVDMAGSPPAGQRVKKGGRLGLGKLPSPVELMGRKKKGRTGGAAQSSQVVQPRVAAVLQHIGDLRRRQSSIDQLKRGSWWGSKPRVCLEDLNKHPILLLEEIRCCHLSWQLLIDKPRGVGKALVCPTMNFGSPSLSSEKAGEAVFEVFIAVL